MNTDLNAQSSFLFSYPTQTKVENRETNSSSKRKFKTLEFSERKAIKDKIQKLEESLKNQPNNLQVEKELYRTKLSDIESSYQATKDILQDEKKKIAQLEKELNFEKDSNNHLQIQIQAARQREQQQEDKCNKFQKDCEAKEKQLLEQNELLDMRLHKNAEYEVKLFTVKKNLENIQEQNTELQKTVASQNKQKADLQKIMASQKEENTELLKTVNNQKEQNIELQKTVASQKEQIDQLWKKFQAEQALKERNTELLKTAASQKERNTELLKTVNNQKEQNTELLKTVASQKEQIDQLWRKFQVEQALKEQEQRNYQDALQQLREKDNAYAIVICDKEIKAQLIQEEQNTNKKLQIELANLNQERIILQKVLKEKTEQLTTHITHQNQCITKIKESIEELAKNPILPLSS